MPEPKKLEDTGDGKILAPSGAMALPPWDMYMVAVSLFSGYILIPLLVTNILLLVNPFLELVNLLLIQQVVTLFTWIFIFVVLRWKYGPIHTYLGLIIAKPKHYYFWEALKLLLLTSSVTLFMSWFWNFLEQQMPGLQLGSAQQPYADYNSSELMVLTLFAVLVAPVLEELIFRGFVQTTFHKIATPVRSVIFTGLVFLLLHGSYFSNIRALTHVMSLGLLFGIWRERTQSLVPGMAAHLVNNVLASLMLFYQRPGG